MTHKKIVFAALLVSFAAAVGCSTDTGSEDVSPIGTGTPAFLQDKEPASENPAFSHSFGEMVTVPNVNGYGVFGVADYIVSAPYEDQGYQAVDLTITVTEGNQYITGTMEALTASGEKVEAVDWDFNLVDQFQHAGSMVEGETRTGKVFFNTDDKIEKVFLYHGTVNPPVTSWTSDN